MWFNLEINETIHKERTLKEIQRDLDSNGCGWVTVVIVSQKTGSSFYNVL
jgi:hypothetical protein